MCLEVGDGICGNPEAAACASPGIIMVEESLTERSYRWWLGVMLHEYAHVLHFFDNDGLYEGENFNALFHGDNEHLADCMAVAFLPDFESGYKYQCSPEQIEYATQAWSGHFN